MFFFSGWSMSIKKAYHVIRGVLYASLFCLSVFAFANEHHFEVISLGSQCLPARQLEIYKISSGYYPFDWAVTQFDALMSVLKNDFKNFGEKENLKVVGHEITNADGTKSIQKWVVDTKYNISYPHGIPAFDNINQEFSCFDAKQKRRIKRFYDTISSGKHIFFFRHLISKSQAIKLRNLLDKKFPSLKYTLVATDYTDEIKTDWNLKKIKNFYLGKPINDWDEQVADIAQNWPRIFTTLGLLN